MWVGYERVIPNFIINIITFENVWFDQIVPVSYLMLITILKFMINDQSAFSLIGLFLLIPCNTKVLLLLLVLFLLVCLFVVVVFFLFCFVLFLIRSPVLWKVVYWYQGLGCAAENLKVDPYFTNFPGKKWSLIIFWIWYLELTQFFYIFFFFFLISANFGSKIEKCPIHVPFSIVKGVIDILGGLTWLSMFSTRPHIEAVNLFPMTTILLVLSFYVTCIGCYAP